MNENHKNTRHYTAEDIQRYLKGQMSAEEMHAIEIASLDDPFLADAIEGFQGALAGDDKASVNTSLRKLNEELQERVKQPAKVSSIAKNRWWNIAAAALILIVAGVAFYNNRTDSENSKTSLAVKEKANNNSSNLPKAEEKSTSTTIQADTQNTRNETVAAPAAPSNEVASKPLSARSSNEAGNQPADQNKSDAGTKASDQKHASEVQQEQRFETLKEERKAAAADHTSLEKPSDAVASPPSFRGNQVAGRQNHFSGRVVNEENRPLTAASVIILQNNTSTITDESGNFSFSATDSVVEVQVGMVGYDTRRFRLRNDLTSNKLVLAKGSMDMDNVVVGYGSQRKQSDPEPTAESNAPTTSKKTRATVKVQGAIPSIGWVEYQKYLEKSKRPPSSNPLLTGEAVISFQVRRTGMLSDFKVEKSLSKDHDAEAIRLIREGPEWKILDGRKPRITVIVKF